MHYSGIVRTYDLNNKVMVNEYDLGKGQTGDGFDMKALEPW